MLQRLRLELLLDVGTEGHRTLVSVGTVLGVVAAEGDELLADGTAAVRLAFADLGVRHDSLHLLAGRQAAVGVSALARVHQRLDAALNRLLARNLRVGLHVRGRGAVVQVEAQSLHRMVVAHLRVAARAQVKVLQRERVSG